MSQTNRKPVATAIGTALAGGLLLSGSSFAITPLAQGYLLGVQDAATATKAHEGNCGAHKDGEEGACGVARLDTDGDGKVSRTEFEAAHADKTDRFDSIDTNRDGFIDAAEHDAHHAARHGAAKADSEGKCGEGKCGEGKCGGSA